MAQQSIPVLTLTMTAAAALSANRFVTPLCDVPAADVNTLGVTRTAAASGAKVSIDVLGTTIAEAGGTFSAGASLKVDNTGKCILWASSGAKVAIALEDGASGRLVEVLLIPNVA